MIGKKMIVLGAVLGAMMMAAGSYAEQPAATTGSKLQKEGLYKGMTKEQHMKAFPAGHPAVSNQNRCYWDEEAGLFFCQYDDIAPTVK